MHGMLKLQQSNTSIIVPEFQVARIQGAIHLRNSNTFDRKLVTTH